MKTQFISLFFMITAIAVGQANTTGKKTILEKLNVTTVKMDLVGDINYISFSNDSKMFCVNSSKTLEMYGQKILAGNVFIGDTTGKVVRNETDEGSICSVFSADNKTLYASTTLLGMKSYVVLDTVKRVLEKIAPEALPFRLLTSKDGTKIIAALFDGEIEVYDIKTQKLISSFKASIDKRFVIYMFFLDDQKTLLTQCDGMISYWDIETGKQLKTLKSPNNSEITISSITENKKTLMTMADREVVLWDVEKGEIKKKFETGTKYCGAISPDGSLIALGFNGGFYTFDSEGNVIRGWGGQGKNIKALAFSPNGKYLVAGFGDGQGFMKLFLSEELTHPSE